MTEGELFQLEEDVKVLLDSYQKGCTEHGWDISDRLGDILADMSIDIDK